MSIPQYQPPKCLVDGIRAVAAAINEASKLNGGVATEPMFIVIGKLLFEAGKNTPTAQAIEMRELVLRLCGEAFDDGQLQRALILQ